MKISEATRRADSNARCYGGVWQVSVYEGKLVISEKGTGRIDPEMKVIYSTLKEQNHGD